MTEEEIELLKEQNKILKENKKSTDFIGGLILLIIATILTGGIALFIVLFIGGVIYSIRGMRWIFRGIKNIDWKNMDFPTKMLVVFLGLMVLGFIAVLMGYHI